MPGLMTREEEYEWLEKKSMNVKVLFSMKKWKKKVGCQGGSN